MKIYISNNDEHDKIYEATEYSIRRLLADKIDVEKKDIEDLIEYFQVFLTRFKNDKTANYNLNLLNQIKDKTHIILASNIASSDFILVF